MRGLTCSLELYICACVCVCVRMRVCVVVANSLCNISTELTHENFGA